MKRRHHYHKLKSKKHSLPLRHVIKSSGDIEPFSLKKFQNSLKRAGLEPKYRNEIAKEVVGLIRPGVTTKDIFRKTFKLIKKQSTVAATKYSLKKAILELGPAGFVFEQFVARYFEAIGFETYIGAVLQGEYVRHEVDIVASKKNYQVYIECKFHNTIGKKNDIKVVLYVKARWDDLKNGPDGKYLRDYYIVSNTEFTEDAIAYAEGSGLKLLGINAPEDEPFLEKIKKLKLYPITSLKRLKHIYCQELLSEGLILCSDLFNAKKTLVRIGMNEEEIRNIYHDVTKILS